MQSESKNYKMQYQIYIMLVRCWFRMFYEAAQPQVELQNQHLTNLVAVTIACWHPTDHLSLSVLTELGVEISVAMVTATK